MTKICTQCHKQFDEFEQFKMCGACRITWREYTHKWRAANRDKLRESDRKYKETHREELHVRGREYNRTHQEARRKYREENKEKRREQLQEWRRANPEKVRAQTQRQYEANHEKKLEVARQYRLKNPEKIRENYRKWYAEHREERAIYQKAHIKEYNRHWHNRRARIKGNGGVLPKGIGDVLFEQQGGICYLCGKLLYGRLDDIPSIEHKIPVSRGGSNDSSNIGLAHLSCNRRKSTKTPEEFLNESFNTTR